MPVPDGDAVRPRARSTIVVGVDGSAEGAATLRWAAEQAELTGSSLRVVMAWQQPEPGAWPATSSAGDPALRTRITLRRLVQQVLGESIALDVSAEAVQGPAAPVLLEAAQGASLLVVGDRGQGGFAGLRLGSVALHCVTHAPCPVAVARGGTSG